MSSIKNLANQTLWYGASNVGARFLNYLLTPLITYLLQSPEGVKDYGNYSLLYAWIAVANIIFTYGFETGFFRFSNKEGIDRNSIFQTTFGSIILSTIALAILLIFLRVPISHLLGLGNHPDYITWCIFLIGLDTLSTIPFAKLRQDDRPKRYAFIKLSGIVVNIIFTVLLLVCLPKYIKVNPQSFLAGWYSNNTAVGFLILANLFQNIFVFLTLFPEWKTFQFSINYHLWEKIFKYSSPIVFIGIAAMINEVMDRQMLATFLPLTPSEAKRIVGIYSANYKLAIFITLFIQAFKLAAEPFFFDKSKSKNAPIIYAHVMKWFIIVMASAFLFTSLYLDIWKYFIGSAYRRGLGIVPILLAANICLGIYYNLSIWYKLTDKMRVGMYITFIGAVITLLINYFFIPEWGMYASAWATFFCYFVMMLIAYLWGQKFYPIPYNLKRAAVYLGTMLILFFAEGIVKAFTTNLAIRLLAATFFMGLFLLLLYKVEHKAIKGVIRIKSHV